MEKIINFIRKNIKKTNTNGVVVALSGGIDSAVVSNLAHLALKEKALIVALPIGKMPGLEDAKSFAKQKKLNFKIIDLTKTYKTLLKELNFKNKLSKANLKSRLRMSTIYGIANENNYLVLGTTNASELLIGYFTKFGDGASDLLPISHLYKNQVYKLAKELNIPSKIIEKKPSADLWEEQTDEEELGFTYNDIENYINNKPIEKDIKNKIEKMIKKNKHKTESIKKL